MQRDTQRNTQSNVRRKIRWISLCLFVCALVGLGIHVYQMRNIEVPYNAVRESREPLEATHYVDETDYTDAEETCDCEYEDEPQTPELLPRIALLREQYDNPDIVGFIEITGTNISYPVAQTGNNVFYLYHDLSWNRSSAGSIFLDYENNLYQLADDNTIIYGHNMHNGSMFHNIRHFHREEFFRNHTYILLCTPYRETVWDIFAFFHTTIAFCYLTTNFHSREAFYDFLMELQGRSIFETDIVLSENDQILILSTCGVTGGENRYVVVSRLRS